MRHFHAIVVWCSLGSKPLINYHRPFLTGETDDIKQKVYKVKHIIHVHFQVQSKNEAWICANDNCFEQSINQVITKSFN